MDSYVNDMAKVGRLGKRVNGRQCRTLVQNHIPFRSHGSLYGRKLGSKGYGVFSYGEHWPLHVWDGQQWHHNEDRYSVTTSKHFGRAIYE